MPDANTTDQKNQVTLVDKINGVSNKAASAVDRRILQWHTFQPDKPFRFTWAIQKAPSGHLPTYFDWTAIDRLIEALASGQIAVSGIPEASSIDGWQYLPVPPGFFRVARWRLYRDGSRLTALDSSGHDAGPAWGDVRLEFPTTPLSGEKPAPKLALKKLVVPAAANKSARRQAAIRELVHEGDVPAEMIGWDSFAAKVAERCGYPPDARGYGKDTIQNDIAAMGGIETIRAKEG